MWASMKFLPNYKRIFPREHEIKPNPLCETVDFDLQHCPIFILEIPGILERRERKRSS